MAIWGIIIPMSSHLSNTKHYFFSRKVGNPLAKGFTLIELMVTVGIFVMMTALVLSKYNAFYSGTVFTNMAYDVALTIRQAQSYGVSVKADTASNSFNSRYGVRFDSPTKFELVSYDPNKGGSLQNPNIESYYSLKQGAKFKNIYFKADHSGVSISNLSSTLYGSVVFQRPNPEPVVCYNLDCASYSYFEIVMQSGDGSTNHTIIVNSVGQISVK